MEVFTTIDRKVSKYLQGDGIYKFSRIVCFVVALLFFMNQALGLFDGFVNPHCSHPLCNSLISNIRIF